MSGEIRRKLVIVGECKGTGARGLESLEPLLEFHLLCADNVF